MNDVQDPIEDQVIKELIGGVSDEFIKYCKLYDVLAKTVIVGNHYIGLDVWDKAVVVGIIMLVYQKD